MWRSIVCFGLLLTARGTLAAAPPVDPNLKPCGDAYYLPSEYTCYDGDFLCPVIDGTPTLRCGPACYLESMYSCADGNLVYPPNSQSTATTAAGASGTATASSCESTPKSLHLSGPPYENYFYWDCHTSVQVVVTSPLSDSNLTLIGPRLLVAWPGGNSGTVAFFAPQNGANGSLAISLSNSSQTLLPIYQTNSTGNTTVGVSAVLNFNSSAVLSVAILGSIRTIRDFTEGPSILYPEIQNATIYSSYGDGGVALNRVWLDNNTLTTMSFTPMGNGNITLNGNNVSFDAGSYNFSASYDFPQLTPFNNTGLIVPQDQDLFTRNQTEAYSLSFLSYTTKLLAGGWRFLTYFGRDSMIATLLLQPVLTEGEGGAIETVIGSVLERLNQSDGSVCHEETIGDYATFLHMQNNVTSTAPLCTYPMIDTDHYLPILMQNYFVNTTVGQSRAQAFFSVQSPNDFGNGNLTYGELALINAEKIMNQSAAFAAEGGQTRDNLLHLKEGQIVGEWRDSTYGIGGGRIPYDVNTALVPAALRAIASLANAGIFPTHPDWNTTAAEYAQVWEDSTLQFFEVMIPQSDAKQLVQSYASQSSVTGYDGPSNSDNITSDINFYGLSLEGNNNQSIVKVMNTDDCFRLFMLNSTNQTQLTFFVNQTADHILQPFPVGLSTSVGLLIANPAYGGNPVYAQNWTSGAYQGIVVWSWPLAMMAAGLERQLERCNSASVPDFCSDSIVFPKVKAAYNHLWDLIEANAAQLETEVWSWIYTNGGYKVEPLGNVQPPPGQNPTESDIVQLWSLTFLAVTRNPNFS